MKPKALKRIAEINIHLTKLESELEKIKTGPSLAWSSNNAAILHERITELEREREALQKDAQ